MNKYNILTIHQDLDMLNPYDLHTLTETDITRVPFSSGMTLNSGQWTYDTNERAFWFSPSRTTNTRGYLKLVDDGILLHAEDEIIVSYEIKVLGDISNPKQLAGVRIDCLNEFFAYSSGSYDSMVQKGKEEYQPIKFKHKVNPSFTNITNCAIVFGVLTSPLLDNGYTIKIRNIKVEIIKNRTPLGNNKKIG